MRARLKIALPFGRSIRGHRHRAPPGQLHQALGVISQQSDDLVDFSMAVRRELSREAFKPRGRGAKLSRNAAGGIRPRHPDSLDPHSSP